MKELIRHILREHNREISEQRKPKWSKEIIQKIADKYEYPNEFKKNDNSAWQAAKYNGWYDEVTAHMGKKLKSWDKDSVMDLAKNYTKMNDFIKNHPQAYSAARGRGWIEDVQKIMTPAYEKWDKDRVFQEALKYQTKNDFRNNSKKAYDAAILHGWYDEVTAHMNPLLTMWTKDKVRDEALKYKHRSDFQQGSPNAYQAANSHGWMDDVSSHMEFKGTYFKRLVYVYEFSDNTVYVGLTLNKTDRDRSHRKEGKSSVYKHIMDTGLEPEYKIISDDYIDAKDAQNLENCTIEEYKSKGWKVLNKAKAGGLGGSCLTKWTKDMAHNESLKYDTITKFMTNSRSAYNVSKRNGWIPEITKHMKQMKVKRTPELLYDIMGNYTTINDFRRDDVNSFQAAYRLLGYDKIKSFYDKLKTESNLSVYLTR